MEKRHRDQRDMEGSHVREIREKLKQLSGGEFHAWESDAMPKELREQFWENVLAFETAPMTTDKQQLIAAGIELPDPPTLSDDAITAKLWEVIHALARMRVFLDRTDHLSDRELYTELVNRVLLQESELMPPDRNAFSCIDLLGGWSEEDTQLYLKYYADENWRKEWLTDFPDINQPPHQDPPYDRDRLLPAPFEGSDNRES